MKKRMTPQIRQRLLCIIRSTLFVFLSITQFKASASTLPDVIRTGGSSKPHEAKVAVLVSQSEYVGLPFTVANEEGVTVFNGTLKKANILEPWNYAAIADFSELKEPGRYRVHVENITSRPWDIDKNAGHELTQTFLELFVANRDGYEPSSLHGPAHLHDASIEGGKYNKTHFDLTGGWMDAGDQIHFTETTAYAAIILQLAAKLDPINAEALRNEADVGIRWLLKAHPLPDLFIGQVGDIRDHGIGFRDPAEDDQSKLPGIGYRLAYPASLSGLMGKAAAALALAAERNTGEERIHLLAQAKQWYQQGKTNQSDQQLADDFYNNLTWHDDMSFAAAMLWRVTGDEPYQEDAYLYLDDIDHTLSVTSIGVLTAADLCGTLGNKLTNNSKVRKRACDFLRTAAQEAIATATIENAPWNTPGSMIWGQLGFNGAHGAIVALAKRANLIKDASVAVRARDWLLGLNPWGNSFVVGYGSNPPTTPHHWASVFSNDAPKGTVVGGPASSAEMEAINVSAQGEFDSNRAIYSTRIEDYISSEGGIVYNANTIFLISALNILE
ncbi:glycoside hydrolase family 9 protein [Crenothrix sp.]|uniref:glycoside hydrolase family 9 protein n=1 Tax=Crenothrix sp. TaxID=3100433 RepID=UPI00374D73BD